LEVYIVKKLILAVVSVAAFFFIVGSVGALENNGISMLQCIIQCAIGATAEWFSLKNMEG
jgi:hypothetical protein